MTLWSIPKQIIVWVYATQHNPTKGQKAIKFLPKNDEYQMKNGDRNCKQWLPCFLIGQRWIISYKTLESKDLAII